MVIHGTIQKNQSLFFITSLVLVLLLVPCASANTARDPTLRSQLYEQFRCGNGICDLVESALTCPEDCPGEPEPTNVTIVAPPQKPVDEQLSHSSSAGFESISTLVPADDMFEEPSSTQTAQSTSSSSTSVILIVLLVILIVGVILYALRNTSLLQPLFHPLEKNQRVQTGSSSYQSSTHASTILAGLIDRFKKRGLTPGEMYQRITRMGLWDDETIRRQLGM
ncbi:MAG: hypothetical protein Q7R76_05760 [Candidatus Woesearchaeota archaeon]|nr:hypothetical protein [Candidatus Woesearchaeota archaeon]